MKSSKEDAKPSIENKRHVVDRRPILSDGWQIDQTFGQCMLKMFDAQLWTDVTFRCFDQAKENLDDRLHAHKIILAARSPVFQAMLFGPCKEFNEEIEIRDIDSEAFEMFLRLLYSDDLDLFEDCDDIVVILNLAHRYQIQETVDRCCRKLVEKVSISNACVMLDAAMLFENDNLISRVTDFIDKNAENVLATDAFLDISLRCLTHILKGNTFFAREADIFTRAVEWAKQRCGSTDGQVIRKTLGDAFYYLRTPSMTHSEFIACTKKRGYYNIDEYEDISDNIAHPRTSEIAVGCNSRTFRRPLEIILKRSKKFENPYLTTSNNNVNECVSICPKDDIHVTSICLKRLSTTYDSGRKDGFPLGFVPLHVAIFIGSSVKGSLYKSRHNINSSEDTLNIQLHESVLLSFGKFYRLDVNVSPNSVNGWLMLGSSKCETEEHYEGTGCEFVSASTKCNYFQVLDNITFMSSSKRN